jgi:hypothetical protein
VLLAVPTWLTAAHLATATLLFALLVVSALRAGPGPQVVAGSAA